MVKKGPNVNKILRQIFSKPKDFIFFIVFSLLVTGFAIASVVVSGSFVNKIISDPIDEVKTSFYIAPLILLVIGFAASFVLMGRFKSSITANISKELKQDAYLALLQAEMSEFDKDNYEKEVAQFEKNVEKVSEDYIGKNILSLITIIIFIVGFFITGLVIEPIFAFILLAIIPLYTTADKTCSVFVSRYQKHYNEELKNSSNVTYDTIKNLKNIKILSGIDTENEKYEELNNNLSKANHNKNVSSVISRYVLPFLFIGIAISAMWGVGGLMVASGSTVKPSSYVVFPVIVPVIILLTYNAFHLNLKGSYVENEVASIEKITGLRSEIRSEPIDKLDDIHTIRFEEVGMADTNVLNNVSFEIKQGEKIGIFSLSKETRDEIFDLITKIDKPDAGLITFNNCELNKINAKYLRTLISSIYDDS
ncbi:MAG: ABC transporter ATP-binding protein [Bacilli bacterium]|nr:ABC transporter ATP-binding protein [Bacilli bacterium]